MLINAARVPKSPPRHDPRDVSLRRDPIVEGLARGVVGRVHTCPVGGGAGNPGGLGGRYRNGRRLVGVRCEIHRSFEPDGSLHHQLPATITVTVEKYLLGDSGLHAVRDLVRSAATTLDAVTGHLHGSGGSGSGRFVHSPFEQRRRAEWNGDPPGSTRWPLSLPPAGSRPGRVRGPADRARVNGWTTAAWRARPGG
ncbi:hypothetical protein GCM10009557_42280 [Virgisporangium ochraceum]|uniref:Uncharacterized protein n=1 Tax=Virgisporangium ochraceum TaxID=65505 RepID=A0A8J4A9B4_9ACTN|nr:hypothetical protein Voc01_102830 [Virgisporangium ochraceum]